MGTVRWRHHLGADLVSFQPGGKTLASVSQNSLCLWDVASGMKLRQVELKQQPTLCAALSGDGHTIALAADGTAISLWDVATAREFRQLSRPEGVVASLAFSPDGKLLAVQVCFDDAPVALWDVATGKRLVVFDQTDGGAEALGGFYCKAYSLAFSPDGRHLAVASERGTVCLGDVATGKKLRQWKGRTGRPACVAFSSDGRLLALEKEGGTIGLVDVAGGREVQTLRNYNDAAYCLVFLPRATLLASVHGHQAVRLWEVTTGRELRQLEGDLYAVRTWPSRRTARPSP